MALAAVKMTESSQDLETKLRKISEQAAMHARFLNTLSFLEYMGARKIIKSQRDVSFDCDLLAHLSEEIRHAQVLKRLALKVNRDAAKTYAAEDLLGRDEAVHYIQGIDRAVEQDLSTTPCAEAGSNRDVSWLNYLYTSLLIEERAEWFYGAYLHVLTELGMGHSLKGILKEEVHHLDYMREQIGALDDDSEDRLERLRHVEAAGWRAFFARVEAQGSGAELVAPGRN